MGNNLTEVVAALTAKDSDGDGIRDIDDLCPLVPGPAATQGCPFNRRSTVKARNQHYGAERE